MSGGGGRVYTLSDVIATLNDNVNQANSPQDTDSEVDNSLASVSEDIDVTDSIVCTTFTAATINTYNNGFFGSGSYA